MKKSLLKQLSENIGMISTIMGGVVAVIMGAYHIFIMYQQIDNAVGQVTELKIEIHSLQDSILTMKSRQDGKNSYFQQIANDTYNYKLPLHQWYGFPK